jgi:hypothetical protein
MALCGMTQAQTSAPSTTNPANPNPGQAGSAQTVRLAPGSVIPVVLSHTVDAKKAKIGDSVEAKIAQDLKTAGGQVLVPKDSVITGHVTASQPHSKGGESELAIVFDHATLKNGQSESWPLAIQAIIGNNQNNNALNPEPESGGGLSRGGMSPGQSTPGGGGTTGRAPSSPGGGQQGEDSQPDNGKSHPPITASTQGVIGMPELKMASSPQGTVITSEKGNVKLEGGTFLLLRAVQPQ